LSFWARWGRFFYLLWAAFTGNLSANPLSDLTNETGVWTLRFLCITLAITPLRKLNWLEPVHQVPAHGRPLCLLLRLPPPADIRESPIASPAWSKRGGWVEALGGGHAPGGALVASTMRARSRSRSARDIYKRPFITIGFARVDDDAAAGDHVDDRMDPQARRQTLEPAAQTYLSHRHPGTAALLVAGESRRQPSAHLCSRGGGVARWPGSTGRASASSRSPRASP